MPPPGAEAVAPQTDVENELAAAVERLAAKAGEVLLERGPVTLDAVTVARFVEAVGVPPADPNSDVVPPTLLNYLFRQVDIHRDERPRETADASLGNPVNGGTSFEFSRRIRIGEVITARTALKSATTRRGRSGLTAVVTRQTTFLSNRGDEVAKLDHTMIYRGRHQ